MSNTTIEDLSREDLLRILNRDRFVKEQMSARIGSLIHENIELLGIIQELQGSVSQVQAASNGEVTTPVPSADVTS